MENRNLPEIQKVLVECALRQWERSTLLLQSEGERSNLLLEARDISNLHLEWATVILQLLCP